MDITSIAAIALKGALYIGSTSCLLALSIYIFLLLRGDSPTLLSTVDARLLNIKHKVFLGLAAVGFLVSMYQGADVMLAWIPYDWGTIGDDGEFHAFRSGLAGVFSATAGIALIYFVDQASRDRAILRAVRKRIVWDDKIHRANSKTELDALETELNERLQSLRASSTRAGAIGQSDLIHAEDYEIDVIQQVLRTIAIRREVRR